MFLTAILAWPAAALADPSVAVSTVPARRGALPVPVEAFGSVVPSALAPRALSVNEAGRVERVLVGPGAAVAAGDPLLVWDQSSAARQSWEQAVASLSLAGRQRAHAALLLDRHLATRDQLDQADTALIDARTALDALRRDNADQPRRTIRAPVDGTVSAMPVAAGDVVAAGAPLAVVAAGAQTLLSVGVEPREADRVRPGQTAHVTALVDGRALSGSVVRVDARIDPLSHLVTAEIATNIPLRPGEAARATIDTGTVSGWLVPHAAVLEDQTGAFLFQAYAGHAIRVAVTPRVTEAETDLVDGPLDPSRPVVVIGAPQLSDGAALRSDAP